MSGAEVDPSNVALAARIRRKRRVRSVLVVVALLVVAALVGFGILNSRHRAGDVLETAIRESAAEVTDVRVDTSDGRRRGRGEAHCSLVVSAPARSDVWQRVVRAVRDEAEGVADCTVTLNADLVDHADSRFTFTSKTVAHYADAEVAEVVALALRHANATAVNPSGAVRVSADIAAVADLNALADTVSEYAATLPDSPTVSLSLRTGALLGARVAAVDGVVLTTFTSDEAELLERRLRAVAELAGALPGWELAYQVPTRASFSRAGEVAFDALPAETRESVTAVVDEWFAAHPDLRVSVEVAGEHFSGLL